MDRPSNGSLSKWLQYPESNRSQVGPGSQELLWVSCINVGFGPFFTALPGHKQEAELELKQPAI